MKGARKSKERLMSEILNIQVTTSILDNIIDLVWVKDLDGNYVMVSESFAMRHKQMADELIGKTDFDIHPYDVAVECIQKDKQVIAEGKKHIFLECEVLKNGTRQYFEICKNPVYDFTGKIVGILSVARDVTERKNMEESLIYISEHDELTGLLN